MLHRLAVWVTEHYGFMALVTPLVLWLDVLGGNWFLAFVMFFCEIYWVAKWLEQYIP